MGAVKRCAKCGGEKHLTEFYAARNRADGLQHWCKGCCKAARRPNPQAARKANIKFHYGLTMDEHDALLEKQGGVCAICREPPEGLWLNVDHDHSSGAVRGLLCNRCNTGLGLFQDDTRTLRAAVEYLDRQGKLV